MEFVLRYLGTVAAVILTVYLVPGISIQGGTNSEGLVTVFLVAVVWSVLTMVIRPVLTLLTLPITIITFGIFSLILNALLFWIMAAIVPGFAVSGFVAALLGSIVLSILSWLVHQLI